MTGLLLIVAGLLGMLLLFGYVALRLLTAAAMSLLYLLLIPGVVVVPALGERGRALFRAWAGRLFGALMSKLVFAFLLGVLLAVTSVVESLDGIGWWAQWLLLSAFWWATFLRRHQLLAMPPDAIAEARRVARHTPLRGLRQTFDTTRQTVEWRERRKVRQQLTDAADAVLSSEREKRQPTEPSDAAAEPWAAAECPTPAEPVGDEQALRTVAADALALPREAAAATSQIARRAPRRERIEHAYRAAASAGDVRRASRLGVRRDRLSDEDAADQDLLVAAAEAGQAGDGPLGEGRVAQHARFLDLQSHLPAAASGAGPRRDYPALAGLVQRSRAEYEGLPPGPQRVARLDIDRELAARRDQMTLLPNAGETDARPGSRRDASDRLGAHAGGATVRRRARPSTPARRSPPRGGPDDESEVMSDARAVAEGRKRQLGIGRP